MKYLIASDIHGSAKFCRLLFERIADEKPDALVLLGDELYHGPRNDLPEEYAPKEVISMLNSCSVPVTAVRGNCDAEVDQMVLGFPIMADYALIQLDGLKLFATHGHVFSESNPPANSGCDVLLCGHTHIPACRDHDSFVYINPGSVSIPKENSPHSYMTLQNGVFSWKDVCTGAEYRTYTFREK